MDQIGQRHSDTDSRTPAGTDRDLPPSLYLNSFIRKKFTIDLKPADPEDDPRCAISYFIEYDEKKYQQALNGTLPYQFLLQRVSDGAGKKRHWWSSK